VVLYLPGLIVILLFDKLLLVFLGDKIQGLIFDGFHLLSELFLGLIGLLFLGFQLLILQQDDVFDLIQVGDRSVVVIQLIGSHVRVRRDLVIQEFRGRFLMDGLG
jgi:hypothetical protein